MTAECAYCGKRLTIAARGLRPHLRRHKCRGGIDSRGAIKEGTSKNG